MLIICSWVHGWDCQMVLMGFPGCGVALLMENWAKRTLQHISLWCLSEQVVHVPLCCKRASLIVSTRIWLHYTFCSKYLLYPHAELLSWSYVICWLSCHEVFGRSPSKSLLVGSSMLSNRGKCPSLGRTVSGPARLAIIHGDTPKTGERADTW